jgi:hypothetical protein
MANAVEAFVDGEVEQIVRLIKGEISNHLQRIGPRHYAEFIR